MSVNLQALNKPDRVYCNDLFGEKLNYFRLNIHIPLRDVSPHNSMIYRTINERTGMPVYFPARFISISLIYVNTS